MATLLENRITRLRSRKSDPQKNLTKVRNQNLAKSMGKFDSSQDAKDYISESMDAVESEYTKKTFDESERIQNQIKEACETQGLSISFRNQGSVTNDTHIKFFSDIDLLVITEQFITLKSPLQVTSPYQGDPLQDLKNLRNLIERRLESSFRQAKVDKQGPKAVRISGGSLSREVDVIPANWYDTQEYRNTSSEVDRGIQILDLSGPSRIANFPFLHNKEINQKDILTNGALRKSIRFVKSAKYDSNDDKTINVSSYDITSLCYHIPTDKLLNAKTDLNIALVFLDFSEKLVADSTLRENLSVPNKTRLLFGDSGISVSQLKLLNDEVRTILAQAQLTRSF